MTADPAGVTFYFRNKASQWIQSDGSVETHVRRLGKEGLAAEFQGDRGFADVCALVRDLGELQARDHIVQSIEDLVGDQFNWPLVGEMDMIIGGMALACGFKTLGDKLVMAGAVALGSFAVAGIIAAILAGGKK